jgi:hypothetical protein
MTPFLFELALLCMLVCTVFPFALIGVASSGLEQRWQEGRSLLVSACAAICVAGAWFAAMLY